MARFETGTYAQVISTGRIGEVVYRERTIVTVNFFDKSSTNPETLSFNDYELKVVELPRMKTSQLRSFVRGEISFAEITKGVNIIPEYLDIDGEKYTISVEDLLAGMKVYVGKTVDEIDSWIATMTLFEDDLSFSAFDCDRKILDSVRDKDIIAFAHDELDDICFSIFCEEAECEIKASLKKVCESLESWIASNGKDLPDIIKYRIASQFDSDSIDDQSEETQQLFKECLDYCCDVKKDPKAIQRRGYCIYCGTKVYPNDWIRARDAFIEYYNMTGDASAANTLGYIYYYGRCNGGVPQYEEAFKYFSIGHAFTYFESTYKLADMFAHGYGVVKDGETANHLYWGVYKQCLERFIKGNDENKFPDAALRMGNCFRDGLGVEKDLESAYFYYLQADYGIRCRIAKHKYYGDTVVYNRIQEALASTREEYADKGRVEQFVYPEWTKWALPDNHRCKLSIKELKDGVLSISARPLKRRNEQHAPKMLVTVPRADYCELVGKITIKTSKDSSYRTTAGNSEIVFDSVEYDWLKTKTTFYLYDEVVGEINTASYKFTAPKDVR